MRLPAAVAARSGAPTVLRRAVAAVAARAPGCSAARAEARGRGARGPRFPRLAVWKRSPRRLPPALAGDGTVSAVARPDRAGGRRSRREERLRRESWCPPTHPEAALRAADRGHRHCRRPAEALPSSSRGRAGRCAPLGFVNRCRILPWLESGPGSLLGNFPTSLLVSKEHRSWGSSLGSGRQGKLGVAPACRRVPRFRAKAPSPAKRRVSALRASIADAGC